MNVRASRLRLAGIAGILALMLASLFAALPLSAQPFIQVSSNDCVLSGSLNCSNPASVTVFLDNIKSGDLIVVTYACIIPTISGNCNPTINDHHGGNYSTPIVSLSSSSHCITSSTCEVYAYAVNETSSGYVITATDNALTTYAQLVAYDLHNVNTSAVSFVSGTNQAGGVVDPTITLSGLNADSTVMCTTANSNSFFSGLSVDSGYTQVAQEGDSHYFSAWATQQSSSSTCSAFANASATNGYVILALAVTGLVTGGSTTTITSTTTVTATSTHTVTSTSHVTSTSTVTSTSHTTITSTHTNTFNTTTTTTSTIRTTTTLTTTTTAATTHTTTHTVTSTTTVTTAVSTVVANYPAFGIGNALFGLVMVLIVFALVSATIKKGWSKKTTAPAA